MSETISAPTQERWYSSPAARSWSKPATGASLSPIDFHRTFPSYAPTPLRDLPSIASELGVARVFLKDESARLGLPAFKILGASWAVFLALCERTSLDPASTTLQGLQHRVEEDSLDVTLVAATDGNHGRAVAHLASLLGLSSKIYVPSSVAPRSRDFIASEGAGVVVVDGSYDEAVQAAADDAAADPVHRLLIQDTSWAGYEVVPAQIVAGYTTLFAEIETQLGALDLPSPSLVVVPVGVGSLAHAATLHFRSSSRSSPTALLSVEPTNAPCLLTSLLAGISTPIHTSQTIMPGLNCGTVSPLAWPDLLAGIDTAVSVTDSQAEAALRALNGLGIGAGPCGAATLAGVVEALEGGAEEERDARRTALGLEKGSIVVLISTEGSEVFLGA